VLSLSGDCGDDRTKLERPVVVCSVLWFLVSVSPDGGASSFLCLLVLPFTACLTMVDH
jgi:hypothetical protein